jgi:hypothetical protein
MMDIVLMRSRPHRTSSSSGVFRPLQVKASKPRRCAAKGIEVARVEIAKDGKIIAMIGNEQCEFAGLALLSDILYDNVIQQKRSAGMTSAKTVKKARLRGHRPSSARTKSIDPMTSARVEFALSTLAASGKLKGSRTKRLSARVDPGLIKAARSKTGLDNDSELVNAALAVLAAPDDFGPWFAAQAGRLPKDFELEI